MRFLEGDAPPAPHFPGDFGRRRGVAETDCRAVPMITSSTTKRSKLMLRVIRLYWGRLRRSVPTKLLLLSRAWLFLMRGSAFVNFIEITHWMALAGSADEQTEANEDQAFHRAREA